MANKKRIIVVDDDPDIRLSVKQILEKSGYKVY
jgi:DNA-binding response OmpR family regulator